MNDPSNSDVLYFRPDSMVVEQKEVTVIYIRPR